MACPTSDSDFHVYRINNTGVFGVVPSECLARLEHVYQCLVHWQDERDMILGLERNAEYEDAT